jgi:hypothetical protein
MSKLAPADMLEQLGGTAEQIDREIREFAEAAKVLSSDHPRLIETHPLHWVGVYQGRVAASAKSLDSLMKRLDEEGIPREKAIVRFIDNEERTLIL